MSRSPWTTTAHGQIRYLSPRRVTLPELAAQLALGILVGTIGKGLPLVALPFSNYAHAAHPASIENVGKLRSWGVTVLFGPHAYPCVTPGREATICTCSRGRKPSTPSSRAGLPGRPGDSSKLKAPRRDTGVQPARPFSLAG
jgi:hypothetical protein